MLLPNNGGELRLAGRGSVLFWEEAVGQLTLREALASRQLDSDLASAAKQTCEDANALEGAHV